MRHCKIVTCIIILSILNFALGAPAAVREGPEMSVDVDVAQGGTATSQKRFDPLDDWSTTNAAGHSPTPSIPSDLDPLLEGLRGNPLQWYRPPTLERTGSIESVNSNGPNYGPPNPGSPTAPSASPRTSMDHFPIQPGWLVNLGTLSSTSHQPTPPQSPTGGSPLPPLPHPGPSEDRFPSTPGLSVNPDTLPSTDHQSKPPHSPTGGFPLPPLPHPGLSEGRFPSTPGWSVNPDTLPSTSHQPTPPQSPPVTRPPPPPSPEPSLDFLDKLLKGKIRRRISGSGTVNSAQMDPRSTNIPT